MKNLREKEINRFQLYTLLNDKQKEGFEYIVNHNVYCANCGGAREHGIDIVGIVLDKLNDVRIKGTCKNCKGEVTRIIEYGENEEFYQIAMGFRKTSGK